MIGAITGALKSGGDVEYCFWGIFSTEKQQLVVTLNGEPIQIKASKMPKFKPGTPLKEAVN